MINNMEDIVMNKRVSNGKDISGSMHEALHSDNKKERRKVNTRASIIAKRAGWAITAGAMARVESNTLGNLEANIVAKDALNEHDVEQATPVINGNEIILPGDDGKDEGMTN